MELRSVRVITLCVCSLLTDRDRSIQRGWRTVLLPLLSRQDPRAPQHPHSGVQRTRPGDGGASAGGPEGRPHQAGTCHAACLLGETGKGIRCPTCQQSKGRAREADPCSRLYA
jgi:hypothetical protein